MSNSVTRTRFGLTRRRVLTNAQVLNLQTVPIELVPPQGVDQLIIPILAIMQFVWVADYTNIDAGANLFVESSDITRLIILHEAVSNVSQLLASGVSTFVVLNTNNYISGGFINPSIGNIPSGDLPMVLVLDNQAAGNLTGGNPGNSLIVTAFYNVMTLG